MTTTHASNSASDDDACIKFWKRCLPLRNAETGTVYNTACRGECNSRWKPHHLRPAVMAVPCEETGDSQDGRNPEVQTKSNQAEHSWANQLIYLHNSDTCLNLSLN